MIKYKNRHGDTITLTEIDDNSYKISSSFQDFYRTGYDANPNDVLWIDFSGGPFLRIGENLKDYFGLDKVIKSFKFKEGIIIEV